MPHMAQFVFDFYRQKLQQLASQQKVSVCICRDNLIRPLYYRTHHHRRPVVVIAFSTSSRHDEQFWASLVADSRPRSNGSRSFSTVPSHICLSRPGLLHFLRPWSCSVFNSFFAAFFLFMTCVEYWFVLLIYYCFEMHAKCSGNKWQ